MVKLEESLRFLHFHDKNWCILKKVPTDVKHKISELSESVKNNPESFIPHNDKLAGQIQKEYRVEFPDEFLEFISKILLEYRDAIVDNIFEDFSHFDFNNWVLGTTYFADDWSKKIGWVNFQKKYEYNPSHTHDGHLSFIYWDKVPYTRASEMQSTPSPDAVGGGLYFNYNGATMFYYGQGAKQERKLKPSEGYGAQLMPLPVTSKWEGVLCIFPSYQLHSVNPFYSSDDYRISYSGNIIFKKPTSLM